MSSLQKINEIQLQGDYNGQIANIHVGVNHNGDKEFVSMKLNNDDLKELLGIQPINIPLEKRLKNDFLYKQTQKKRKSQKSRKHKRQKKHNKTINKK